MVLMKSTDKSSRSKWFKSDSKWPRSLLHPKGCSPDCLGSARAACGPFWNHHRSANVCFSCFLACLDSILSLCVPTYFSPSLLAILWRFWPMTQRLPSSVTPGDRSYQGLFARRGLLVLKWIPSEWEGIALLLLGPSIF